MATEIRSDAERADLDGHPAVLEESRIRKCVAIRNVAACCAKNVVRFLPDVDRNLGADVPGQAVMVSVRVRNEDGQQTVVTVAEPGNFRKQALVPLVRGVKRKTDIERNALGSRLNLDARTADLLCSAVDANVHV